MERDLNYCCERTQVAFVAEGDIRSRCRRLAKSAGAVLQEAASAASERKYITGTSCTVVLCGGRPRKFVDWEIKATLDKEHALIGVNLPTSERNLFGQAIVPTVWRITSPVDMPWGLTGRSWLDARSCFAIS